MSTQDITDRLGRVDAESVRTDTLQVGPRGTVIGGAWQTWTPTFTTGGVVGAGTVVNARYTIIGRTCFFKYTLDQTAAGTAGSNPYLVSLPPGITAVVGVAGEVIGAARVRVATTQHTGTVGLSTTGTTFSLQIGADTVATAPWAGGGIGGLNSNDLTVTCSGTFEIAN
jgi:hypothetical protein